jgi:hypothetical protein
VQQQARQVEAEIESLAELVVKAARNEVGHE